MLKLLKSGVELHKDQRSKYFEYLKMLKLLKFGIEFHKDQNTNVVDER